MLYYFCYCLKQKHKQKQNKTKIIKRNFTATNISGNGIGALFLKAFESVSSVITVNNINISNLYMGSERRSAIFAYIEGATLKAKKYGNLYIYF